MEGVEVGDAFDGLAVLAVFGEYVRHFIEFGGGPDEGVPDGHLELIACLATGENCLGCQIEDAAGEGDALNA